MASRPTRRLALAIMGTAVGVLAVCGATWVASVAGVMAPGLAGWVILLTDVAGVTTEAVLVLVGAGRAVAARHMRPPAARNWVALVVLGSLAMAGLAQAKTILLGPGPGPAHPAPSPVQPRSPRVCDPHPVRTECLDA